MSVRKIRLIRPRARAARRSRLTCPLCHDGLSAERRRCPGCDTPYHGHCLDELGGCATLGCPQRGVLASSAPMPLRLRIGLGIWASGLFVIPLLAFTNPVIPPHLWVFVLPPLIVYCLIVYAFSAFALVGLAAVLLGLALTAGLRLFEFMRRLISRPSRGLSTGCPRATREQAEVYRGAHYCASCLLGYSPESA
jgi:hypothetical protein